VLTPPKEVKDSTVFNGNGKLGNIEVTTEEVSIFVKENFSVKAVLSSDDKVKDLEAKNT
jgi:hypothetical protein